jgi:predicted ABC-type sugar transport system permease subunit
MGGIGTIGGTIIGAFIMSVLKNGLNLMGVSVLANGCHAWWLLRFISIHYAKIGDLRSRKSRAS